MASDVRAIEIMLKTDENARRSISAWIVQIAKKIHEKPEDVVWFFEMRQLMDEVERLAETTTDEELEEWERELEAEQSGIDRPLEELLEMGRRSFKKFKRIEVKLRELGVV
ncbi:hypothetical protein [Thermococcus camini]|uniref:Uncharacterized protein n=1 Tax=Thermococcus camini TaxID=2016373 RepID=A0A7G2DAB0_9EURY|nr:hypothetical protein [Thermococcus camini]CAD5244860.1 conserved protein of unknown function [Thermococcus camini]